MNGTLVVGRGRDPSFMATSSETIAISTDPLLPTYLQAITQEDPFDFFEYDATEKAMRNVSGRTLNLSGTLSYNTKNNNNSQRVLSIFSQSKIEGGPWEDNADSARKDILRGANDRYVTKASEGFGLPHRALIRFGFFASAVGVSFLPVTINVNGAVLTGPSFKWTLKEL
jgi:hypothetical protein